jgi:hypothetical protein
VATTGLGHIIIIAKTGTEDIITTSVVVIPTDSMEVEIDISGVSIM